MGSLFEIAVIFFLTLLNGLFSMSETAVVSARKARLQQRAEAGNAGARAALHLANQPERFLSTVQIGITLIGILAGAFGGAKLSEDLAKFLQGLGVREATSQSLGFGLVVAGITYLSLVIGELVPKRLALNNAEGIASFVAKPMNGLSRLTSPLVWVLSVSGNALLWLLRVKPSSDPTITEEEIRILIRQGTTSGVFAEEEQEIVERVFRTADRRAVHLMSPRKEIVWLDVEDSWEDNRQKISDSYHSVFPLCRGSLDHVLGVVPLKNLWVQRTLEKEQDWEAVMRKPLYVLETTRALELLDRFKAARDHFALVVDEFGVVSGVVTLHDVMEAMVGEVPTLEEVSDLPVVQREDGSWLMDGMLPKEEFQRLLKVGALPEAGDYSTLGGFVMQRLGRIPVVSDHFEYETWRFEVMDMDGHRVDKVLVMPAKPFPEEKE